MISPVARIAASLAHLRQPNVFERTAFVVGEIDEICMRAERLTKRLKLARHEGNRDTMREAAEDLAQVFSQGQQLALTAERVLSGGGA